MEHLPCEGKSPAWPFPENAEVWETSGLHSILNNCPAPRVFDVQPDMSEPRATAPNPAALSRKKCRREIFFNASSRKLFRSSIGAQLGLILLLTLHPGLTSH